MLNTENQAGIIIEGGLQQMLKHRKPAGIIIEGGLQQKLNTENPEGSIIEIGLQQTNVYIKMFWHYVSTDCFLAHLSRQAHKVSL